MEALSSHTLHRAQRKHNSPSAHGPRRHGTRAGGSCLRHPVALASRLPSRRLRVSHPTGPHCGPAPGSGARGSLLPSARAPRPPAPRHPRLPRGGPVARAGTPGPMHRNDPDSPPIHKHRTTPRAGTAACLARIDPQQAQPTLWDQKAGTPRLRSAGCCGQRGGGTSGAEVINRAEVTDMPPAGALRLRDGGGAACGCRPCGACVGELPSRPPSTQAEPSRRGPGASRSFVQWRAPP